MVEATPMTEEEVQRRKMKQIASSALLMGTNLQALLDPDSVKKEEKKLPEKKTRSAFSVPTY